MVFSIPNLLEGNISHKELVFTSINQKASIPYGRDGSLTLDFYEPKDDKAQARPLVILVPGGGFTELDVYPMRDLASVLAKAGYTAAVINYRVADIIFTSDQLMDAAMKGIADLKAAIRFFKKDATTKNIFKIDTNNVFIGGHSAGAIISLHAAYLNQPNEANTKVNSFIKKNGGIEGDSGHAGFSSSIKGVINLSGAIFDVHYIKQGDPIILSIHGDQDEVVPLGTQTIPTLGEAISLDGSASIHAQAQAEGIISEFIRLEGGDHLTPVNQESCTDCFQHILNFLSKNL